ncbi:hypothetical protein AB0D40_04620 [Streptomyces massasporeus]|uniref:hypothetical protein n=1 Tax=Streptomyces massasporeus TaxID=67324 RepID=UPI0033FA9DCB
MLREQAGELAEITVMADDAADWALSNRLDRLSATAATGWAAPDNSSPTCS